MTWDDLRYLEALVRRGSAAAAARELRVSTSTVYQRIAALEETLGVPCLRRDGGQITPTEVGAALLETARRTREELLLVRGRARDTERKVRGEVSLTTVEGFMPLLDAPLARLAERHPGLRVVLHLADTGPSVRKREVDVALGVMARPPVGLVGRRLFRIEYGVFGTAEALVRSPRRWVVAGAPMLHTPESRWEREHAEHVAVATGSRLAFFALVRAGHGVALMPRRIAALHPELRELEALRAPSSPLGREAWLLMHPDLRRSARVRALRTLLIETLGE